MKRPPMQRWLIGQPIVSIIVFLLGIGALYLCYLDPQLWYLGLFAIGAMAVAGKASREVRAYNLWMREWEAMGPNAGSAQAPAHPAFKRAALAVLLVVLALYLYANRDVPDYRIALICIVAALALVVLAGVVGVARWARRGMARQKAPTTEPVAICVRRALLPVPDLQRAYEALPDHCWRTLNGVSR